MSDAPRAGFPDHFSGCAPQYAEFRPAYPPELAAFLASVAPSRELAWEAGCGSGQMTALLARHFSRVVAVDASAQQVAQAPAMENVEFRTAPAEHSGLEDGSAQLAVAAQAVHWFDIEAYYAEVRRVCVEGAVLALISYGHAEITPAVNAVVASFYKDVLDEYWPPERRHVDAGYATLAFPFSELDVPKFAITAVWDANRFLRYVDTWSAVRGLRAAGKGSAFDVFATQLGRAWGAEAREVRWPLAIRSGRVSRQK